MEKRGSDFYERLVLRTVQCCEERNTVPLEWAKEATKPSAELGHAFVSLLCFDHNRPPVWKFLEESIVAGIVFVPHVFALLSLRVVPHRRAQPQAFLLYMELLNLYAVSFHALPKDDSKEKIIKSVDDALHLSETYGVCSLEIGHVLVLFLFSVVEGLVDSLLDDCESRSTDMDVDYEQSHKDLVLRFRFKAMEVLRNLTERRKSVLLLRLVHINMPEKFYGLLKKLQLLGTHWGKAPDLNPLQLLAEVSTNVQNLTGLKHELGKRRLLGMLLDNVASKPKHRSSGFPHSASWVALDTLMESAMDGKQLPLKSIDVLAELTRTLQRLNEATWQETFLAFWLSALRVVQRDREPAEGPIPHLEARLSALLCIVPLAISKILEDNTKSSGNAQASCSKKQSLISSLQILGQFSSLLCPPSSVIDAANDAATKAAQFVHNTRNETVRLDSDSQDQGFPKRGGNMRHLIVEACIARNLIDTSAYLWPDYVSEQVVPSSSEPTHCQKSPWLAFMEGEPLNGPLINSLVSVPASSLVEIEKLYSIALNASDEEKKAAAKILCGASLRSGWNIQEHVVRVVVKLLRPPIPPNYTSSRSHLIDYMPMLSAILFHASSLNSLHILALHGMAPDIAAYLVPLCEVFGSLEPTLQKSSSKDDEPSAYMVFSSAFLFLVRLWRFYRPKLERNLTEHTRAIGNELNLNYLLLLHNSSDAFMKNEITNLYEEVSDKPVYIDSYPNLWSWYLQNMICVSSTFRELPTESPVSQIANKILCMIDMKINKHGSVVDNNSSISSGSGSPSTNGEDLSQLPMIPAWQILKAIPSVLHALLNACAHGRLSSRNFTTVLRDLIDFLPASLAAIISYFTAEVTRGVWKYVPMNGKDWPSPAPLLPTIESELKEILSSVGVSMPGSIPKCSSDDTQFMLPLPMAVLASLTITFKLDRSREYIHVVAGLALENIAACCVWPGMPIIASLWAQKVRRWHDFIVVSCAYSVFKQDKDAMALLIRGCFASFLGPPAAGLGAASSAEKGGVSGLLGFKITATSSPACIAPGFLYLRSCRQTPNVVDVPAVIVKLMAEYAREVKLKPGQASIAFATTKLKEVAMLGVSLLSATARYRLVQELYTETVPTWLEETSEPGGLVYDVFVGYAVAYLTVFTGAVTWSVQAEPPQWKRMNRVAGVGFHMDFLARSLRRDVILVGDVSTWKAYVAALVGLMLRFTPTWIRDVKAETLQVLARRLRRWQEPELALSLLEQGGIGAMGLAAKMVNILN